MATAKPYKWFHENGIKANQDKCHFPLSLDISTKILVPADILENLYQNLFGVNFNEYVINLCNKTCKALARIFPIYPKRKKKTFNGCLFDVSVW